ncbi:SDR family NAD(P)-dependent oxidoreductase [Nesterenkonia halotolerans]|uniref:SDR family NAD(P)-dependent oxidoreductase n=1 Tax=Nesterenkonia halotolerans TaxID=225325 RepID=UPI003EE663D2
MTQHITTTHTTTAQPSTEDSPENQAAGRHAGKVALVMGGARGIGAGIVGLLAAEGARVTFTYASATSEAEELERTIAASGGTAVGVKANSSNRSQVREVITELAALEGRGDRQLNRALNVIAMVRMVHDPQTRAYVEKRRSEGKTDREIRRVLKRYLAQSIYRELNAAASTPRGS